MLTKLIKTNLEIEIYSMKMTKEEREQLLKIMVSHTNPTFCNQLSESCARSDECATKFPKA
ncbi:hypothetical protein MGWOODY_Hyp756 [hydrothermal vent metagenome]|uniref:Uncharacterized protein n=1 Tax=hydrothermal vent metagenome TaxID=652676 RepID=A0A160U0Q8_9ZZZZ